MGFSPSRSVPDSEYRLARAEAEAMLARHASTERAADAHHQRASVHLTKLFGYVRPPAQHATAAPVGLPTSTSTSTRAIPAVDAGYFLYPGAMPEDGRATRSLDRL